MALIFAATAAKLTEAVVFDTQLRNAEIAEKFVQQALNETTFVSVTFLARFGKAGIRVARSIRQIGLQASVIGLPHRRGRAPVRIE